MLTHLVLTWIFKLRRVVFFEAADSPKAKAFAHYVDPTDASGRVVYQKQLW